MTLSDIRHAAAAVATPMALAFFAACAFPLPSLAQAIQPTPRTPLAQSTAGPEKALAPVVVTSARAAQSAADVLGDVVIIGSEEIRQSGAGSLPELLQRKRGVEISRSGGPGTASSVFLRGTNNNQSVVLIDGVRTSSSTSGGATWQSIPLSQIDHVEIVYGPLSSLYGADAMGGVIQIFTRRGDGPFEFDATAGAGSYATRLLEAGVSGTAGEGAAFRYALSAAREQSDGFSAKKPTATTGFDPDRDGYRKDSVSGRFSIAPASGHEVGLNFLYNRLDSQFDSAQQVNSRPVFFDDRNASRLGTLAVYSRNRFTENWTSLLQIARSIDRNDSTAGAVAGRAPAQTYSVSTSTFDTTQDLLSWQNDLTFGPDLLQLVLERREEKVDSSRAELQGRSRTTDSAAAAYQVRRGSHLASIALRSDRSSQFGSSTTGSLGYGYRFTPAWRANASVGTSFRAPTFNELYFQNFGNPASRPEEGRNAEAGVTYDDGRTQFSAVYYRNSFDNLIVTATPCPTPGVVTTGLGCAFNVNKALLNGVTVGAGTKFGRLAARGSFDWQDARDETTGKRLIRRAKRHGTLGLEYAAGSIVAGMETVFSGQRYDDTANRVNLPGYGLLNLYASYDIDRSWSVFGRWNNVLNKDYELAKDFATEGSTLFVGARYRFR